MQDNVVLGHYKAVIKQLKDPLIAVCLIELNLFVFWIDGFVIKNTLVILALGIFPSSERHKSPV